MWSKIKAILRTLKARTEEALVKAIAKALGVSISWLMGEGEALKNKDNK